MKEIATFNVVDYLTDEDIIAAYLKAAADADDVQVLEQVLLDVELACINKES